MRTKSIVLKNNVVLDNNVFLAPMAGWTDVGFRSLAKAAGAGLCFTEMISAKALVFGSQNTREMLAVEQNERPCAVQLFGNDPDVMAKAINLPELEKFDIIDINMGCPAAKIVKNREGCFLMTDLDWARKVVRACVLATHKPVSVKFRKGWDDKNVNAVEFARMCEEEGAAFITVHGRTKEQEFSGECDLEIIKKCKEAVSIPVIANGGILSELDAKNVLEFTGADGVMIGRAALGNLEIFAKCANKSYKISKKDQILTHFDILSKYFSENFVMLSMRKHVASYLKGINNSARIIEKIMETESIAAMKEIICAFLDSEQV